MSDGDFKFQLSVKFGAGGNFDPHMLNIKGDTAEEFAVNLGVVQEHAAEIVAAASSVTAVSALAGAGARPQPQQQGQAQPQQGGWSQQGQTEGGPQAPQGGQAGSALGQPVRGFAGPKSQNPGREWRARKVNGQNKFVNQNEPDWYQIGRELGIQE